MGDPAAIFTFSLTAYPVCPGPPDRHGWTQVQKQLANMRLDLAGFSVSRRGPEQRCQMCPPPLTSSRCPQVISSRSWNSESRQA